MALEQTLRTWTAGVVFSAAAMLSGCGTTSQSTRPDPSSMAAYNAERTQPVASTPNPYDRQPVMGTGPDGRPMLGNEARAGPADPMYDRDGTYHGGRVHVDQ